ncbi:hypothetical protein Hanom_Chr12g01129951 [Helianthus anomalus]
MQSFPSDQRGRCSVVYKRHQSRRPSTIPADVQMTAFTMGDGEGENPWIIDPHPLEWYGEVLHTPLEVLDIFRTPSLFCMLIFVNVCLMHCCACILLFLCLLHKLPFG